MPPNISGRDTQLTYRCHKGAILRGGAALVTPLPWLAPRSRADSACFSMFGHVLPSGKRTAQ